MRDTHGVNNPNYKNAGWHNCIFCGELFHNYNKERKYCSAECYNKTRQTRQTYTCEHCGEIIKANNKKFCSKKCEYDYWRIHKKPKYRYVKKGRRPVLLAFCLQCGATIQNSHSNKRKYCSYKCFIDSGGIKRANEAAKMAKKLYGAKKDANHQAIFDIISHITAVKDLSRCGMGVPDGIAWVNNGWHLFDVKNPNSSYGKKGLNDIQKKWAKDWRGGPVYLIYTDEDAIAFARGIFENLKKFPVESVADALRVVGVDHG